MDFDEILHTIHAQLFDEINVQYESCIFKHMFILYLHSICCWCGLFPVRHLISAG